MCFAAPLGRLGTFELSISPRTVQAHRRNIAEKLELRGPNRLLEFAVRHHQNLVSDA